MCLSYAGGKRKLADWIVSQFPPAAMFLDVCGGAAGVTAAAARSGKFTAVVYNDIDSRMVRFLMTVRDHAPEIVSVIDKWIFGRRATPDQIRTLMACGGAIDRAAAFTVAPERLPARRAAA